VPAGRLEIAWTIDENNDRLHLTWTEKGGPPVRAPSRQSFGTRLIETLGKQLNGKVGLAYDSKGLIYALDVPLSSLKPPD
jgi:two-component sensor histidine kinase